MDLSNLKLRNEAGETLSNYSLIEQHAQAIEGINNDVIPEFSEAQTYTAGQIVFFEGAMYRAADDMPAQAFGDGDWAALTSTSLTFLIDKETSTTTTSTSYTDLANMSKIPPVAGIYNVEFSTSASNSANTTKQSFIILKDATQVVASEREIDTPALGIKVGIPTMFAKIQVDGTNNIKVQWKTTGGTATAYQRQLKITRISE